MRSHEVLEPFGLYFQSHNVADVDCGPKPAKPQDVMGVYLLIAL